MANYKLISQPTGTVISISEAKQQINIADAETYYDAQILGFIQTAQLVVEDKTWRSLLSQQWLLTLDSGDVAKRIEFTKCPIISVDSVQYINSDGVLTAFTDYEVDIISEPARIQFNSIPQVKNDTMNALQIQFTAGYSYVFTEQVDVTEVDLNTDTFTAEEHGLKNGDVIEYNSVGTITGIDTDTPYYLVSRTTDTFKVSLTVGGDPIDIGGTTDELPTFRQRQVQNIPTPIIAAMKLIVGDYFMHREDTEYAKSYNIPNGVMNLLGPYTLNYVYQ